MGGGIYGKVKVLVADPSEVQTEELLSTLSHLMGRIGEINPKSHDE